MRARVIVAGATTAILWVSTALAGAFTPVNVLSGPASEQDPHGNGTYLLWYQNSTAYPRRYNVYASDDAGATRFKLNRAGTRGYTGDVVQGGTEAIYQEVGNSSNIQLIDLATRIRSDPPAGINTAAWEWAPRLSNDYILFQRDKLGTRRRLLILHDRLAGSNLTLVDANMDRVWLYPYHVGTTYATWERLGADRWTAWIYEIATTERTSIPTANARAQYAPVVDEINGNAYWVRGGNNCGGNVRILRAPLSSLGSPEVITTLPAGIDAYTLSLEQDTANARMDLLFTRVRCAVHKSDIYEVQGVDDLVA
jgi:hypothetical protein